VTVFNIHVSLCYCWGPAVADTLLFLVFPCSVVRVNPGM
jgi:hypothetical protein